MVLWYNKPASKWVEALPIGNGRLGAMVFGGVQKERLQLNEDTLYAGSPYDPANPEALAALPEARRLIFEGKYKDAHDLVGQKMMGRPASQMPYQLVGDVHLEFSGNGKVTKYRRELDLDTAITKVSYTSDGVKFLREVFSSPIDNVIVVRLTSDKKRKISFAVFFSTPQKAVVENESSDTLVLLGINGDKFGIEGKLKFECRLRVVANGGTVVAKDGKIFIAAADDVLLFIAAATSYKNYKNISGNPKALTKEQIQKAIAKPFNQLREEHIKEHQRLFRRVSIDLGVTDSALLPTDQRPAKFLEGKDPNLAALYFQYGRYLLISCSRSGTQPANLQGLWNDSMDPPWQSKYTININTEMNYWPAEPTNLSECHEPLLQMVTELVEPGSRTAKVQYGASGWVCHHNTDLWRATAPIDGPLWGFWPTGGAWLCTHLWNHYEFTNDKEFLKKAYPVMKGAAQFFVDALVEEPKNKWLVTSPSISPENVHPGGVAICAGPTMDMQIIRDLFSQCIKAAEILETDKGFSEKLDSLQARLAPMQIGKGGQLQEWLEDWDMEAPEQQHRHVSHLYGLFPSNQITPQTPELFAAAKKTLEYRGDGGTGWSLAWKINFWARLLDGDHAYLLLQKALTLVDSKNVDYQGGGGIYPNLFDAHPPFQIDGNFGAVSGITEMLLQSHLGEIHLLPALPSAWKKGSVSGLRARGGFEVDIDWKNSNLKKAIVKSVTGTKCIVRYQQKNVTLEMERGASIQLNGELNKV